MVYTYTETDCLRFAYQIFGTIVYGLYPLRLLRARTASVMSAVVPGLRSCFWSLKLRSSLSRRFLPRGVVNPPLFKISLASAEMLSALA